MHELGIVFYIIRDVKKVAEENHVDKVSAVVMDIGEVSTVVPDYLQDCWKWATDKEPVMKGCALRCNIIPAVTVCNSCGCSILPSNMAGHAPAAAVRTLSFFEAMRSKSRK